MPATKQSEPRPDVERHRREIKNTLIGEQLMAALGQPSDLLRIQVRALWADNYRVNVFVGPDVASAHVAASFFVRADADGNVLDTTPKVVKQFGPTATRPAV